MVMTAAAVTAAAAAVAAAASAAVAAVRAADTFDAFFSGFPQIDADSAQDHHQKADDKNVFHRLFLSA